MIRMLAAAFFAAVVASPCAAQYPDRPVTMLAGFPAGGLVDIVARVVAEGMKPRFPKGIVVVNKPGAGGAVAVSETVQAKPDGYTILLTPQSSLVIPPQQTAQLAYKTPDDYDPVINVISYYPLLVVKSDAPWKTIEAFVADARANPGKMRIGTPGEGTASHLNLEEFIFRTETKMIPVPYAGWAQSSVALLGGHIEAVAVSPAEVTTHVQGGKLKVLMVMADKRVKGFEKVPTAKERGIDLSIGTWRGLGAPKNTPPEVMAKLREITAKTAAEPLMHEVMDKQNLGYVYTDGAVFKETLAKDNAYFKALIAKLNIKP